MDDESPRGHAWARQSRDRIEGSMTSAVAFMARHKGVAAGAVILIPVVLVVVVLYCLDGPLKCLSDCGPAPADGWAYKTPLNLPGPRPSETDRFPSMMSYQLLSGDLGFLAKRLLPYFWYLPLLPPAFFLAIAVACFSWMKTPSEEKDLATWILKLFVLIAPISGYLILGFAGAHSKLDGLMLITLVAVASALASAVHWWLFAVIAPSYSRQRMAFIVNRRRAYFLLTVSVAAGGLLNGAGALLIRDTLALRQELDPPGDTALHQETEGFPPRLFEPIVAKATGLLRLKGEQRHDLGRILDILGKEDIVNDDDLRQVRRLMETLTLGDRHNPVSLNLCRSGWYIVLCCVCLTLAVSLGKRYGRMKLMFVLATYLSIGTVFGLIYYGYFLLDAGRYHLLINTLFVDNAHALDVAIKKCGDDCDELRKKLGQFQRQAANHEKLLGLMASGYFASSVFAQDTPSVAIENDPPEAITPTFTCNYQFRKEQSKITPTQPLFYGHQKGVTITEGCVSEVLFRLSAQASVGADPLQTNRSSSIRLADFLCNETAQPTKKTERDYIVRITSAADCTGKAEKNDGYSLDRGRAALVEARTVVNAVAKWAAEQQNKVGTTPVNVNLTNISRLRQAFMGTTPQSFTQRRGNDPLPCDAAEYDDILWPAPDRGQRQTSDPEVHPARTALIEVLRRSSDVTDRLHMQSGLTRHTTLSDMVYFSFVSFTTTGYGDIKAVSGPVRFCVIMENILEILFAAIFFTAAMAVVRLE